MYNTTRRSTRRRSNQTNQQILVKNEMAQTIALRAIKDMTSAQLTGILPSVRDIQMPELKREKVYTFTRSYVSGLISASPTVDQFGALNITLASFPSSSEFTSLFDLYRINAVQIEIIPLNPLLVAGTLYTVIDVDDSSLPSGLGDLLQYDTLQVSSSTMVTRRTWQPRIALAAFAGSLPFTSYASPNPDLWIDVASPSVQYYGLKYWLPAYASTPTSGAGYQVLVKAVLQFKHPR